MDDIGFNMIAGLLLGYLLGSIYHPLVESSKYLYDVTVLFRLLKATDVSASAAHYPPDA